MTIWLVRVEDEFKVNDYITLKLKRADGGCNNIHWDTVLYLGGEENYYHLNTIINPLQTDSDEDFAPRVKFRDHCSEIQAWAEKDYDTRLLRIELAFTFLKYLVKIGDPIAKNVFKNEIIKRFLSGDPSVMRYLTSNSFIYQLNEEDRKYIIKELELGYIKVDFVWYENHEFQIVDNDVLTLGGLKIDDINKINRLEKLKDLKDLEIFRSNIKEIKGVEALTNLEVLRLIYNNITEIKGLENLKNLNRLDLHDNKITEIKGLENLKNLKRLDLHGNKITKIKGLEALTNLEELDVSHNNITEIKGLENLKKLIRLDLQGNKITEIKGLEALLNLKNLHLLENRITEIKGLENLKNLTWLGLSRNKITEIKGLESLIFLEYLHLENNNIIEIKGLEDFRHLITIYLSGNKNLGEYISKFGDYGYNYVKYCRKIKELDLR